MLQHGNGDLVCSGAGGVVRGKREPILGIVPELRYTPPNTVILVKVTITVTIIHGKNNKTILSEATTTNNNRVCYTQPALSWFSNAL